MGDVAVKVVLGVAAVSIAIATGVGMYKFRDRRRKREQARVSIAAAFAIPMVLWPLVLDGVLQINAGVSSSSLIAKSPWILLAYLWPLILMGADLALVRKRGSDAEESARNSENKMNANILIGCAWAMGTLLAVVSSRSSGHSVESARILMISLITCIAFILPTPGGQERRSVASMTISSLQKAALDYAVGFFVLGILLAWTVN